MRKSGSPLGRIHFSSARSDQLENIGYLRADARAGEIAAAMIAIECRSWGVARNRTHVIRSRSEPRGVAQPRELFFVGKCSTSFSHSKCTSHKCVASYAPPSPIA